MDYSALHSGSFRRSRTAHGFTIIELLVSLGIVLILLGFLLPGVLRTKSQARSTSWLAQCQQHAHLIDMYSSSERECYPLASTERMGEAMHEWWRCLEATGHIDAPAPGRESTAPSRSFGLSACMVFSASKMTPENLPADSLWSGLPVVVRRSDVLFPSSKGVLWMPMVEPDSPSPERNAWCCLPTSPKGPIAFADQSAALLSWLDLVPSNRLHVERDVGYPVISTWQGARGRDR